MEPIRTSQHTPIGVVYLGLTAQFHYQILEKIVHHPTLEVINDYQLTSDANSPKGVSQALTEDCEKEDEEAFNYQAQLRGLPYDREKSRQHLFRCSLEGHKPIGILTDEHFEKMCNSTKYPSGKSSMMSNS